MTNNDTEVDSVSNQLTKKVSQLSSSIRLYRDKIPQIQSWRFLIMRRFRISSFLVTILLLSFLLISCSSPKSVNSSQPIAWSTNTSQPTFTFVPTKTDIPTPTLTPTPTSVPLFPFPYGTPFLQPSKAIDPDDVMMVEQLGVIGEGYYTDLVWSDDGAYVGVVSTVAAYLYDARSMSLLLTVPSQDSPVVVFSSDNRYFVVSSTEGLLIYILPSLERAFFVIPQPSIGDIDLLPDNLSVATCQVDGTVNWYRIEDQSLMQTYGSSEPENNKCGIQVSGDGTTMAWWNFKSIHLWNLVENVPGNIITSDYIINVALSRDGATLAVYSAKERQLGNTSFWDTKTGQKLLIIHSYAFDGKRSYSRSSDFLALYDNLPKTSGFFCSTETVIWNLSNRKLVRALLQSKGRTAVSFSPDGKQIAGGIALGNQCTPQSENMHRSVLVWDIASGEITGSYPGVEDYHTDRYGALVEYSPTPNRIALAHDGQVIGDLFLASTPRYNDGPNFLFLWKKFGDEPQRLLTRTDINDIVFSMNGLTVKPGDISIDCDQFRPEFWKATSAASPVNSVHVSFRSSGWMQKTWLDINGNSTKSIALIAGCPAYLRFSPDGSIFITITEERTLRVWGVRASIDAIGILSSTATP